MSTNEDEESLLSHWQRVASQYGVRPHAVEAASEVAGLLAGAIAISIDAMYGPNDAVMVAVFQELCRRAESSAN